MVLGTYLGREVALKMVLSPIQDPISLASAGALAAASEPGPLPALIKEAATLSELHHPNVVRVFGYCLQPMFAMVMERCRTSLSCWRSSWSWGTAESESTVRTVSNGT